MSEALPGTGKTVVVGMSGGVDSSVAALLLKRQGYRVIGLFMKNWEEKDDSGVCTSAKDYEDVARVCEHLDIPYYGVEFVKEYWDNVFAQFLREYEAGHTPNPDILCNREIKFNVFFRKAMELGADYLATGHYARVEGGRLLKGVDPSKDQSYFIYTLDKSTLARVLFPVGGMLKSELRRLALEAGIPVAAKKDSTGICFIGERDFTAFLGKYVAGKPGPFRRLDGSVAGRHRGVAFYTVGQRRGLGLGGEGERWYVVKKDVAANVVYVERGDDHPALHAEWLTATEASWVAQEEPAFPLRCRAKIRYRQDDQDCVVTRSEDGGLRVDFEVPQRAIASRQSIVFYSGDECLGGAIIERAGPTLHEQGRTLSASAVLV